MTSLRKISDAAVYLLMTVNIFVYGLCVSGSGGTSIAVDRGRRQGI